jgi:hypothetical protein
MTRDWAPSAEDVLEATIRGFAASDLLPRFIDHYLGTGDLKANWGAVWRNWCRGQAKGGVQPQERRQGHLTMTIAGGAPPEPEPAQDSPVEYTGAGEPPPDLLERWDRIRSRLRSEVGDGEYRNWLRPMRLVAIGDDEITVGLPTGFTRDRVRDQHGPRITMLLRANFANIRHVAFVVAAERREASGSA